MFNEIKNRKEWQSVFFIFIILFNLVIYFPSFSHPSRADQDVYLIETAGIGDLGSLIKSSYTYPRHRLLNRGDILLFRPLFYTFLALQKWFFGFHFICWQIASFLLHLVILWQLTRILWLIRPGVFVFLFVLHFSVLHLSQEMVIWHHMNGYMVFLVCFLETLYRLVRYLEDPMKGRRHFSIAVFSASLGCFFYEFGFISSFLFFLFLWFYKNVSQPLPDEPGLKQKSLPSPAWLLLPALIYLSVYTIDFWLSPFPLKTFVNNIRLGELGYTALCTVVISVCFIFLPVFINIVNFDGRIGLASVYWKDIWNNYQPDSPLHNLNLILVWLIILSVFSLVCIFVFLKIKKQDLRIQRGTRRIFDAPGALFSSG